MIRVTDLIFGLSILCLTLPSVASGQTVASPSISVAFPTALIRLDGLLDEPAVGAHPLPVERRQHQPPLVEMPLTVQEEQRIAAQAIGEEGGCRCDDALCEDIGGEYPLDTVKVSAEGVLQAWNSDVDDGLIQDAHECTENHHQGDNPFVL